MRRLKFREFRLEMAANLASVSTCQQSISQRGAYAFRRLVRLWRRLGLHFDVGRRRPPLQISVVTPCNEASRYERRLSASVLIKNSIASADPTGSSHAAQ